LEKNRSTSPNQKFKKLNDNDLTLNRDRSTQIDKIEFINNLFLNSNTSNSNDNSQSKKENIKEVPSKSINIKNKQIDLTKNNDQEKNN